MEEEEDVNGMDVNIQYKIQMNTAVPMVEEKGVKKMDVNYQL
jgi:hypothetical protein